MSDWRAMNSLLVLREQVNTIAPYRSKVSDGLVGDQYHETTSGHYPHYVAGVGSDIVTAWDCTNDPARGCDTWLLSETLRQHRDKRIYYVISNQKIFSSYATSTRPAWTWGPYSGENPHTGHCHIQVLNAQISDTTTPWNLEGFDTMALTDADVEKIARKVWDWDVDPTAARQAAYVALYNAQKAAEASAASAKAAAETAAQCLAILQTGAPSNDASAAGEYTVTGVLNLVEAPKVVDQ